MAERSASFKKKININVVHDITQHIRDELRAHIPDADDVVFVRNPNPNPEHFVSTRTTFTFDTSQLYADQELQKSSSDIHIDDVEVEEETKNDEGRHTIQKDNDDEGSTKHKDDDDEGSTKQKDDDDEGSTKQKDEDDEDSTKEKDQDDEDSTIQKDEDDDDSIDETQLKDAEMAMTDDQKEEKRIIAEELKVAGNNAFKDGDFKRSAEKYTEGLKICPLQFIQLRAVLFCNRSAAKMKLKKYEKAADDCTKAIELDDKYMKAYIRRAQSYEETQKYDESLADYKKILEMDPSHQDARKATFRLPPLIEEKNEKLKTEMLGKLKDLGNVILKPFGLSTDNFKVEEEPGSKGYKINFKQ